MTPDTSAYYYASYAIMGALFAGYVASLWWRARRVKEEAGSGPQ